jgi:hypothetical protein
VQPVLSIRVGWFRIRREKRLWFFEGAPFDTSGFELYLPSVACSGLRVLASLINGTVFQ